MKRKDLSKFIRPMPPFFAYYEEGGQKFKRKFDTMEEAVAFLESSDAHEIAVTDSKVNIMAHNSLISEAAAESRILSSPLAKLKK